MKKMEKLENDPTVLMYCEWEEDGYHQLETGWTLRGKIGRQDGQQREHPTGGLGAGRASQTSMAEPQRTGEEHLRRDGSSRIPEFSELRE